MASAITKMAANKLLRGEAKKYVNKAVGGDDDPYFMLVKDPRSGKMKKVRKVIPDYIPEHDAKILAEVRKSAYRMDMSLFTLLGVRFGWSSVIGLAPGFGDIIDLLVTISIMNKCKKVSCGLGSYQTMMYLMIALDFIIGLVPFLGDLLDGVIKANTFNVRQLEKRLDEVYKKDEKSHVVWGKSDRARPPPPASAWEDFDDEAAERREFMREQERSQNVQQPPAAAKKSSWFSRGRQPDVERDGHARPAGVNGAQESGTVYNGGR